MATFMVLVTYCTKPGCKEQFIDAVKEGGILDAIRNENGCKRYQYFYPADQEDTILLMEEWESDAHQKVHMTQPHMVELMRLKGEYVLDTKLEPLHIG